MVIDDWPRGGECGNIIDEKIDDELMACRIDHASRMHGQKDYAATEPVECCISLCETTDPVLRVIG